MKITHALVFDVESVGLHGQAFAVAGVVVEFTADGGMKELECFHFHADPMDCLGTAEDLKWVLANVPGQPCGDHESPADILDSFWEFWLITRADHPEVVMMAECAWPVEARFLAACVDRQRTDRNWEGPYPLHDIASILLAAGMDPMAEYDRRPEELPKHDPLADARQSARLLHEAMRRLAAPCCPPPSDPATVPALAEMLERGAIAGEQLGQLMGQPHYAAAVTGGIMQEVYHALTALGADSQLLGTVGSWGDTLSDEQVLSGLRTWNAQRPVIISHFWSDNAEAAAAEGKGGPNA